MKAVQSPTFEGAVKHIQTLISELYSNFKPFLYKELDETDLKQFDQFLEKGTDSNDLKSGLTHLMNLLKRKTGQDVVVLIDEYDTPVTVAYQKNYYDEMIDLMKGLLGETLKDNNHLAFGLLTGITRIAKEGIFSGLNNGKTHSILDERYSEYFGFTEQEVSTLLKQSDIAIPAHDIKDWYNGYQIGSHTIYNPWSILSCLDTPGNILKPYWVNTSNNDLVQNAD